MLHVVVALSILSWGSNFWGLLGVNSRRLLLLKVLLVIISSPVVFEPIDKQLEWHVIRVMEVKALRSHFDELFEHFVLRYVTNNDMLRVDRQDGKAVRNTTRLLLLLLF